MARQRTWSALSADTPFGPIRGLVAGDQVGYASLKAGSMDEFLGWARARLGETVDIETAAPDEQESAAFRADVESLLVGHWARLKPDLGPNTEFQRQVADAVLLIPFGSTASYGDIAVAVGKPGGAQAVGQALSKLPFALFIPSHRVVRVTGVSVGCTLLTFDLKSRLLQWERDRAGGQERDDPSRLRDHLQV